MFVARFPITQSQVDMFRSLAPLCKRVFICVNKADLIVAEALELAALELAALRRPAEAKAEEEPRAAMVCNPPPTGPEVPPVRVPPSNKKRSRRTYKARQQKLGAAPITDMEMDVVRRAIDNARKQACHAFFNEVRDSSFLAMVSFVTEPSVIWGEAAPSPRVQKAVRKCKGLVRSYGSGTIVLAHQRGI